MVRVKHAWRNLSRFKLEPSLELDCRRRATVGRAMPIYRSITVVIKSNKGKRDDRFDRAAATKCHVAVLSASCTSDKTASLDIAEVKYRETSRKTRASNACLTYPSSATRLPLPPLILLT